MDNVSGLLADVRAPYCVAGLLCWRALSGLRPVDVQVLGATPAEKTGKGCAMSAKVDEARPCTVSDRWEWNPIS